MKKKYYFAVCIALPLFFAGCCMDRTCDAFDERYIMFVPSGLEIGDKLTFYSNNGNFRRYSVVTKSSLEPHEYNTCEKCGTRCCDKEFTMHLSKYGYDYHFQIKYSLSYPDDDPSTVEFSIGVENQNYSSRFYTQGDVVTPSLPVIDSMLINNTWYYDLIELTDSGETIHVAKTRGVVQIAEKDGETWWLNEQDKTEQP
jgi:hypothetical protein